MASASKSALYQHLTINKDGKTADLKGKTIRLDYYESLYSPIVTAKLIFVDAGGSIDADKAQDANERKTNIKDGLPITGLEEVEMLIEHVSGKLNLKRRPLKVNSAPTVSGESNRSSTMLYMTSDPGIKNSNLSLIHI